MHTHSLYEICVLFRGRGVFKVEGNNYEVNRGDIFIMRPTESHYIDIDPDYEYERFVIHLSDGIFADKNLNEKLLKPFNDREAGTLNRYSKQDFPPELYGYIIPPLLEKTEDTEMKLRCNTVMILKEICAVFENRDKADGENNLLQRITGYINQNLSSDITLDLLSSEFYISKPRLCRSFKASLGSTVQNYIKTKRMLKARELLNTGISPIKAAPLCGYNDYSSFYRAFCGFFKKPPKNEYIKYSKK